MCLNQFEEKGAKYKRNIAKVINVRFKFANLQLKWLLKRIIEMTFIKLGSPMRKTVKLWLQEKKGLWETFTSELGGGK